MRRFAIRNEVNKKLTGSAVCISNVFDEDSEGVSFYDAVLARFENFDQANQADENKSFSNDVDFIIQCIMSSLTTDELQKKFSSRIDSYLYMYRRIEEYLAIIKNSVYRKWGYQDNLKKFKEKLFELLSQVFVKEKGLQPNLSITDRNQLRKLDINQHLMSITKVDIQTMPLFLALAKLSLQSSYLLEDNLQWKQIIFNVQDYKISLQDFIAKYIDYELAFREFPFNLSGFIELLSKNPIPKQSSESPFNIYFRLCKILNLKVDEFFEQFRPMFENGVKQKSFTFPQISGLLCLLGRHESLFDLYFSIYSTSVDIDDLWAIFLRISTDSEMNEIIQKHLTFKLTSRTMNTSISNFVRYTRFASECIPKIKEEYRSRFLKIYEKIFDSFINKQLNNEQYSYQYIESDLKKLLAIGLDMSTTHDLHQPAYLLILRRLLFQINTGSMNKIDKIKNLFRNLNDFDQNLCENNDPESIIRDDWLEDFLLRIPEDFTQNLYVNTYQSLCDHHHNNRWTIYIWNRIIHLSILKSRTENADEALFKLNEWMKVVQHDIYQSSDTLTIILVINLFEFYIIKSNKSILSLPNIESIIYFIENIRQEQMYPIDIKQVDEFMANGQKSIQKILLLQESCLTYRDLLNRTIAYSFLVNSDLEQIFKTINPQHYKFPSIPPKIESFLSPIPKDVNIELNNSEEKYFQQFIEQINDWLQWFDKFLTISLHIIEWLRNCNVEGTAQLLREICNAKESQSSIPLLHMKTIVERTLKILRVFTDLRRLCHLFNCLSPFQVIDSGMLNIQMDSTNYIRELKRLQPNNSFPVPAKSNIINPFPIHDRQHVQWSIASDKHPCNIHIEYQSSEVQGDIGRLFDKKDVSIEKYVLQGEFETQRAGELIIRIDNERLHNPRTIWYRIIEKPLSTCHLFNGIFHMFYQSYHKGSIETIKEKDISELLDKVFKFIDQVLNGSVSLREMTDLKTIFCDKNIRIREEVKKLFTNRSSDNNRQHLTTIPTDQEIEQVCEWLQIYQYYSHINIIIDCIEKFDILSNDNDDEFINHLKRLRDENCSLREITQAYNILKQQFQSLSSQHLQLIKTASECSLIIEIMKKSDLYSPHGRRRFQELRDNLTTQFQLQERNNMILNSWIIAYALCEPFVHQAKTFDEFIDRIARLSNFEEHSVKHMQIVNENAQIIKMWLSAEETTVLDNALITMEHLYRTGTVKIYLRRLLNEQSFFEIGYSIKKLPNETDDDDDEYNRSEVLKFTLTKSDIDDHKRQLTFCNVDLQENMFYKKILLNEQLKLLKIVENIFHILCKLETAGHPEYQVREEDYEISDRSGEIDQILSELRDDHRIREDRLKRAVKTRTDNLELIYRALKTSYDMWIQNLVEYRQHNHLVNLFCNRQIMILIILLTTSTRQNQIKCHFLEKFSLSKDISKNKDKELQLTIQCLIHYLRSLKINNCDLSEANVQRLYEIYKIEPNSPAKTGLEQLSEFLKKIFNNGRELFERNKTTNENQQYLVTIHSTRAHPSEQTSIEHDFDLDTCCVLLNLFADRLPSVYQILWCSIVNEDDIRLFFLRIRIFRHLIFVIMDIDKMHHRLREILLKEQEELTKFEQPHGTVYYFSKELTISRKGLRLFHIPPRFRHPYHTYTQITRLFQQNNWIQSQIQIICGKAGIGKTHRINTKYKKSETSCFSINDTLNLSMLISSFLSFDSRNSNETNPSVSFNISIHAPFEQLNRTLLSLFISGALTDNTTGLTFSLPENKQWKFFIEIPHTDQYQMTIKENFDRILPILSIISSNTLDEITNENYQLFIGEEEELVARFLKAYENQTIDRQCIVKSNGEDQPVDFDKLTDPDECRHYIYDCIKKYAPELPRNKISELSFTKFLYRRAKFFTGHFYRYNMLDKTLGSTALKQMINEAKSLSQIDFSIRNYPRIYLVYDPYFALHLLHDDWNHVSRPLKQLFHNENPFSGPEFRGKDYYAKCLSWLIDIKYEDFIQIMNETKFILTENFAYKLFHVHERKLTKLSLIIEGDTGVGKTFLLKFYSLLLNSNIINAPINDNVAPRVRERISLWLLTTIISEILESETNLLNTFLQRIKPKLMGLDNDDQVVVDDDDDDDDGEVRENQLAHIYRQQLNDDFENEFNESLAHRVPEPDVVPPPVAAAQVIRPIVPIDLPLLQDIKQSLQNFEYNNEMLRYLWKTLMIVASENAMNIAQNLMNELLEYVTYQLTNFPLIETGFRLRTLLEDTRSLTVQKSIEIFNEYVIYSQIKPLFYRLLLHPGITEDELEQFMFPICQLARELSHIELVVFFDEVNTASCLGLFKEMFMDRTLHGKNLPENIFFTAAINPFVQSTDEKAVHRRDFLVHQLPQALENLKVCYGALEQSSLKSYIDKKIERLHGNSIDKKQMEMPLEKYAQEMLAESILNAQEFCERYLGRNSVSQREIQRCFNLIDFFWKIRFDDEIDIKNDMYQPNPIRCIALALALIYYFRLPTAEDNEQRGDDETPPREKLAEVLSRTIPDFINIIQNELDKFVNTDNFVIPHGVAINQAVREHIFSIVVSVVTRTPLCIIGAPGQSKTLSFQIVLQNLQGSQLSTKPFCKRLPAIDPFFCLGSKYSRSEDIAYIFERAIKREQHYEQNRMNTRCVVFLDEASLPDEKKMVLKVLHPYLDECKVAFVAVANRAFDAANANRMICVYRSLPSKDDQKILAYGCLGLRIDDNQQVVDQRLQSIIYGLCQGYRRILNEPNIPHIYHDRDFIYMLRELRFELTPTTNDDDDTNNNNNQDARFAGITPISLLHALEDNFNGISKDDFEKLVQIFFQAVQEQCRDFRLPSNRRNVPTILSQSMKLDSVRRRLYGRYKLIIDESEDESAVRLLSQSGIINLDPNRTTVFRMSDFPDDIHNELRNVEILSTIKLCMETGKTILMVNTGRIHGSLYDVFNQNFSIMATGDMRKIFSKVAIGPKTIDVVVHEDFQCIIHIKRSEFKEIPAPFLSRFQKYSLSVNDFYRIQFEQLSPNDQTLMKNVEDKLQSFIQHFGRQYFYGINENTLYSCLLSLMKFNETDQTYFLNTHQHYSQLTIRSKSFIEQNPSDIQQCILRSVLSKLLQLVSPESLVLKLRTFEDQLAGSLCINYFQQQEHFHIENFIQQLLSNPSLDLQTYDLSAITTDAPLPQLNQVKMTRKVMIFTRTSSYVVGLHEQSSHELFGSLNDDEYTDNPDKIDILNLAVIENSIELEERFQNFEKNDKKNVLLIVINARINQQRLHIPYVRQLIDKSDYTSNILNKKQDKYFLILIHSPPQELYHQSSFPSIFLQDWDFYFFDSCSPGSAFHLQKMLQILSSSDQRDSSDNILCDLNALFEDCLWDFCSRIQISQQQLSPDMFKDKLAYEFYQSQTNTLRRVQCFKQILQRSKQLQKRIMNIYHEHLSNRKDSSKKIYSLIYQISKDILCGKRFDGLVDSIQSQTRIAFTNFVSNVFKFIINDYGLDTLSILSTNTNDYHSMLELIDYSSFSTDENKDTISQGLIQLSIHYACIPQTPLYHLFHQRIKSYADEIKLSTILKQNQQKENNSDELRQDYYAVPPTTTTVDYHYNDDENDSSEHFRYRLMKSILNDKVLTEIINEQILNSYSNDLVRTFCTIVEKNFDDNLTECEKTIEFVSRWLLLVDENDQQSLEDCSQKSIWLLSHVYTSFEYDQNDLFSLYSACRITDHLDSTRSFYNDLFLNDEQHTTRSDVREKLFRLMFDYLWKYLCLNNLENSEKWIHAYTFISKYYPSNKVLSRTQLAEIIDQINFMNLAYLILLNDKTPEPKTLVRNLLNDIHLKNQNQFANLYLEESERNNRQKLDCWDRGIKLLTLIIDCIGNDELIIQNYHLPYHPSVISIDEQRQPLLDLYFFYLQRSINDEIITCKFVNKIMQSKLPNLRNQRFTNIIQEFFTHLQIYFLVRLTAILLCQSNISPDDKRSIDRILAMVIPSYLTINGEIIQLNEHLQLFLSTIISKRSWNFLLNLFKSDSIQRFHHEWAKQLSQLLEIQQTTQRNEHLQLCHQIQFTLSTDNTLSIFPQFHQSYEQLKLILTNSIQENLVNDQQWKSLFDWIQLQRNTNPCIIDLKEIKIMLLLNIYYDYYCTNRLVSLSTLLAFIENTLEPLPEELRVFRVFLQPEHYMIGYPRRNENLEQNYLNKLFHLDCKDEDELCIRHSLVNLLAMILLGGKQNFLWTFTFQPLTLLNTFGFGSTAHQTIEQHGVHYDCGCIITQNGDLMHFGQRHANALNVPAIYVAYFATFGAMAWHLLLFSESVQNLHGPILAPHAIGDNTALHRLAGNEQRTKVCHFVRARLLSTFNFLSVHSNCNDACILLNRCFERMAFLTLNYQQAENSWIKPVYNTINDQLKAGEEFQNKIFYYIHQKLGEYKSFINRLSLKSEIQSNLQNFITKLPIQIQFRDFKTELHNPVSFQLPLKVLRHILDSTDFLKIMKWIYNLSQFYLLLHQTYTQLVERDEFLNVTLEELYKRGEKHSNNHQNFQHHNHNTNYSIIIDHGIEAVNAYHDFTDGLIRPGACDLTQRFTKITRNTPIHYLVTTGNTDEGDIIMRILRVLIDYHNSLLNLLEQEVNDDDNNHIIGALKTLVNNLISKEVSILQIVHDNTGVITLTDHDCSWIEQLTRATLLIENDEYFQQLDTQLHFDFLYLQSYLIRTYLLLCRINYQHIIQNYQYYIRRTQQNTINETFDLNKEYCISLNEQQLENEWNYLKEMYLDKLYHGYNLLRQIAIQLKHQQTDLSQRNLYEFIQTFDHEKNLYQQIQQYEIKDFQLCYFDHIRQLYANSISDFQHLFTDVSQSLRTSIDLQIDHELTDMLQAATISIDDIERIKSFIQILTDFLNDLRTNEYFLQRQWADSLKETCQILAIESSILNFIPNEIKCENYVALCIHLIRMRTILQERMVNIEEKQSTQWNESINNKSLHQQPNRFLNYLNETTVEENLPLPDDDTIWLDLSEYMSSNTIIGEDLLGDGIEFTEQKEIVPIPQPITTTTSEESFDYSSLFQLDLKLVPLTTSSLFEQIRTENDQTITVVKGGLKLSVTHPDGNVHSSMGKSENLFERLRKLFDEKKHDVNKYALCDKNDILLDFNGKLPKQISQEYFIIEKEHLFTIQFRFQETQIEYLVTSKCNISTIIHHYLTDQDIKPSSDESYLCFFNEHGTTIEKGTINDLIKQMDNSETKVIPIIVTEENINQNFLCQITLQTKQNQEQIGLFHSAANWQHVNDWLKHFAQFIDSPTNEFAFLHKEQKLILDEDQSISSILEPTKSIIIDGIDRNTTTKVTFTYETNKASIYALKSTRISHLLNNDQLLRQLKLIDISPNDCVLVLGETNEQILSQNDMQQSVDNYITTDNQSIDFRISILVQIVRYDNSESISILLPNRNVTMEYILQSSKVSSNIYKYLASNFTKKIVDYCEKLSNLRETKFILVKENETCLISIEKPKNNQLLELDEDDNDIHQRYTIFTKISDIYQENQFDIDHQFLLSSDSFVPSLNTQLFSFGSTSPIRFTLLQQNLPVNVIIENTENHQTIRFSCSLTITIEHLRSIACQLFSINKNYYQLKNDDCLFDDEDITLDDIDSQMTEIQLQLISTTSIYSSIKFNEQIIVLPCTSDILVNRILKETLEKLHISQEDYHLYELYALTDDDRIVIEDDISIEEIYELFPSKPTTIPFELMKKQN
ncbi:hypothetical protein I4U23_010595 [Adineta vaga]|nr:hypothetical protein I4U23_010595 [Adineta vaga]